VPPESPTNYSIGSDTVTDNVTGLIWQLAPQDQVFGGPDAKAYCAGLNLSGRTGWRIPTIIELLSIVDSSKWSPAIDSLAFPGTAPDWYWTSTPYNSPGDAWFINFYDGRSDIRMTVMYSARCVWTAPPAAQVTGPGAPVGQYTISPDTVLDNKTGLAWQRVAPAQTYNWPQAWSYCVGLSLGGFVSGWRLPTKKELETLMDRRVMSPGPTIDVTAFPSALAGPYWMATTPYSGDTGKAWSAEFGNGYSGPYDIAVALNVRCVH
jgi:hypothetical protein